MGANEGQAGAAGTDPPGYLPCQTGTSLPTVTVRQSSRHAISDMHGSENLGVHPLRRTERRLSEAVDESCLVDGHFCGEDMTPPQLRGGGITGVIAVRRARIRRGAPAEGRARGRAGRRWSGSRPQAVIPDAARGGRGSRLDGASRPAAQPAYRGSGRPEPRPSPGTLSPPGSSREPFPAR